MGTRTLTDILRARLNSHGASQRTIAQQAGVSQGQLSRFAAGKRGITLETADALCRVLGLTLTRK